MGVAVGLDGYIYVSSHVTNSVVCISPHGKVIASFNVGLKTLRISVSDDGKTLILAGHGETGGIGDGEIQVYTIIYKEA